MNIPLCSVCTRHLKGKGTSVDQPWQCALCFGIMDPQFVAEVAEAAKKQFELQPFDSLSFVLALNVPVSVSLRESVIEALDDSDLRKGTLFSVPFKLRIVDAYIGSLKESTGLRPTLASDLTLTVTFVNDEFNVDDSKFLLKYFGNDFVPSKKRRRYESQEPLESNFTKVRISNLVPKLKKNIATDFKLTSPTQRCSFSCSFEREPLYLAGRYCKFSRNLPQSPWSACEEIPKVSGNSVSEILTKVVVEETKCDSTRFIASGREDIDVRMLGTGRPFVIQCINPRKIHQFRPKLLYETLKKLEFAINLNKDVKLGSALKKINVKQADTIKIDQEDKRKCYTAYCYSTKELSETALAKLSCLTPLEISQKTPVRVLKRRSLLERKRNIFAMAAFKIDDFHFLLKLETQAGTYVKEFVHGDFGRTQPSLTDIIGIPFAEIDIIDLDVERVNMEWPPE